MKPPVYVGYMDASANAEILKGYKYIPSVQGGYDALLNVANDLHDIGILKPETDVDALIGRSFKFFDGVPDSYSAEGENFAEEEVHEATAKANNAEYRMNDCCG